MLLSRKIKGALLAVLASAGLLTTATIVNPTMADAAVKYKTCRDYSNLDFKILTEAYHPGATDWSRRLNSSTVRIAFSTPITVDVTVYASGQSNTWRAIGAAPGVWSIDITAGLGHWWSIGSVGNGFLDNSGNRWYWSSDGAGQATVGSNHCATPQLWIP